MRRNSARKGFVEERLNAPVTTIVTIDTSMDALHSACSAVAAVGWVMNQWLRDSVARRA
jgi:hypothetical protein